MKFLSDSKVLTENENFLSSSKGFVSNDCYDCVVSLFRCKATKTVCTCQVGNFIKCSGFESNGFVLTKLIISSDFDQNSFILIFSF